MPRSSRHKSKRSVKEWREYSDTEEDISSSKGKRREGKESGEKRKVVNVKDSSGSGHGNGYSSDEYVGSKQRKERSDKVGSDRWNGSGEVLGVESEAREESSLFDDGKVFKVKGLIDLKSKISSLRHDAEIKEGNVELFIGKEESFSGKVESKRSLEKDVLEKEKLDRDLNRKDDYKHKDSQEKEKGSERVGRSMDCKRELDYRVSDRGELKVKKGLEGKDCSLESEYGKHESEKESDRRRKKRIGESDSKVKYQDRDRDSSDVNVLSRRDRIKDGSDRDERHKDITHKDKHNWPSEEVYRKHELEKERETRRRKRIGESDEKDKHQDGDKDSSDVNVVSRRDGVKDGSNVDEQHKDVTHRDKHYWPVEDVYGKHEPEKERETRRRKRTGESDDKDKYQEGDKDSTDIKMISKRERNKDGRDRDEKYKDSSGRDKSREYYDRDGKTKDVDKREGTDRERTLKYDEYSDDRASRDHIGSKYDSKYARGELDSLNSRHKKSRTDSTNNDSSIVYDDQRARYKDVKEIRGSMDKQEYSDTKTRGAKEYLEASESGGAKEETVPERERSLPFHPDESADSQSRRRRSPSTTTLPTRDQYRHSKQSDTKYRESLPEERFRGNLNYGKEGNVSGSYDRAHSSRAMDKSVLKGDSGNVSDLSTERHQITDRRVSPLRLADKSQSPSSADRRHLGRVGDRWSLDYEDSGHRSSGYKDSNYHYRDGKRSQDRKVEAPSMDASSQADVDNLHVSSSFSRSSRTPGNSRLFHPPVSPLKHGTSHSYAGSAEEDGRGKLNNHPKRSHDSSMGRMQGNAWWGAPNWPSPMGNGYLPFPHGPGAVGFHPMMQQFPPQMFGGRPPMDQSGVPFHVPDGDRFPGYGRPFGWPTPVDETCPAPMPKRDSNNMVQGEGFTQGKVDWDQNRSLTASASREPSVDRFKSANSATLESPSSNWRATAEPVDELSSQSNLSLKNEPFHQVEKAANEVDYGGKPSSDTSALRENAGRVSKAKVSEESKKIFDTNDHVRRSCVYLSKIDISAHLAPSDLFDQCVSLLGIKRSNFSDTRMSIFSLEEENDEGDSAKMNAYNSRVSVFAEVSDSLLETAMSLYRQHRDEMAVNYSSSPSTGNDVHHSPEIQGSEPSAPSPSQLGDANEQELVCPGPLNEPQASSNIEDKDTTSIIHPKLEDPSPMLCDKLDVDVSDQPGAHSVNVSASEEVKEALSSVLDTKVTENTDATDNSNAGWDEGKSVQSPNIVTTCNAVAMQAVEEVDDANKETYDVQVAIEKTTTTGLPSATDVHLEGGCEDTMMTELSDSGSVNLSRIH